MFPKVLSDATEYYNLEFRSNSLTLQRVKAHKSTPNLMKVQMSVKVISVAMTSKATKLYSTEMQLTQLQ